MAKIDKVCALVEKFQHGRSAFLHSCLSNRQAATCLEEVLNDEGNESTIDGSGHKQERQTIRSIKENIIEVRNGLCAVEELCVLRKADLLKAACRGSIGAAQHSGKDHLEDQINKDLKTVHKALDEEYEPLISKWESKLDSNSIFGKILSFLSLFLFDYKKTIVSIGVSLALEALDRIYETLGQLLADIEY